MSKVKKLVLFLVGFCLYISIEVCYRGYSYPLMGIVAGICMIINDKLNDVCSWDFDLLLQGIIGSIIVTSFELVIGTLARMGMLQIMWDYTNIPFNYNGVICVPFSLIWILFSIIGIFLSDAINYYLFEDGQCPYYKMFGHVILRFHERRCIVKDD